MASELVERLRACHISRPIPGTFMSETVPEPLSHEAAARIEALEARERVLVELLAPMAACGKRVPEHAWDDDWYTLDGEDCDREPFDKAEQKFSCGLLRRAASALEAK